jgi:hypothetical protein
MLTTLFQVVEVIGAARKAFRYARSLKNKLLMFVRTHAVVLFEVATREHAAFQLRCTLAQIVG